MEVTRIVCAMGEQWPTRDMRLLDGAMEWSENNQETIAEEEIVVNSECLLIDKIM